MNSFYKTLLALFLLANAFAWAHLASGVTVNAVYYASCKRHLGVIIHVDEDKISILSLNGQIETVSRYDIIYLAQYPVSKVPIKSIKNADQVDGVTIRTLYGNDIVELVKGWPVNFSDENIAFLGLDGVETIIDRDSIWEVEISPIERTYTFTNASKETFEFVHPYPFANCDSNQSKGIKVVPQQIMGDRYYIKNELDRLMAGYAGVTDYKRDQRFYPVPQIYSNRTSLTLWYNLGSRHGRSAKRSNNFVPAVVSRLSEGPFGFQRILVTGSAPLHFSVHEEPQTQFYYSLKADYVHFSYFYDIDRLLIGEEQYKWTRNDLSEYDDRFNEVHRLAGGFDYSHYAAGTAMSMIQYAVRVGDSFFKHRAEMFIFDVSYEDRLFKGHFYFGRAADRPEPFFKGKDEPDENEPDEVRIAREARQREEAEKPEFVGYLQFYRLNLDFKRLYLQPSLHMVYRGLRFYRQPDSDDENELTYASKSFSTTLYARYSYDDEIDIDWYLSLEGRNQRYGQTTFVEESSDRFPKAGVSFSLSF